MKPFGRDQYADELDIQGIAADIWNAKHPVGTAVTVFDFEGVLISSVTESAAGVGPMAPAASVFIRGMGNVLLRKVKPKAPVTSPREGIAFKKE